MRSIGDNKRRGAEVGLCALLEERSCIEWVSLGKGRMLEPHQVDGLHLGRGIGQRRERELLTKKNARESWLGGGFPRKKYGALYKTPRDVAEEEDLTTFFK
jgi:hypothetical protein